MEAAGTEMGVLGARSRAVVAAAGLWVLVAVDAVAQPGQQPPRHCLLSHYSSLDPTVLLEVKALRDHYEEETLSWRPQNCSFRPRRMPPPPSSCARLLLVARDIVDTQAVISSLRSLGPVPGAGPTLDLLVAAGRDLAACLELVRPGSSRRLLGPRRRSQKTKRQDSPRCHEAKVIFSLLRLLTWDLRLVAQLGPCL
ncbi:interferon lambda-4-like [Erinaceus europaeus]|uniref:Interferon lambda-4-like n=1 Tax=Erinaceus europaeus TaxID=9365 RepID=A0A1S2ZSZ8_ERIEU|nr:interferon lambda-4-like [Erinaceus europaeus]